MKFRVPRKLKKKLNKTIYLYPYNEELKGYLMAQPLRSQKEYDDCRKGIAKDLFIKNKNND
jgi:hypothetical protein